MRYLKTYKLFENSSFPTDRDEIRKICREYRITNYTINKDGTVDVRGDVNLSFEELTRLQIKFGKVSGNFFCYNNQMTSLEGCPNLVEGNFYCDNNKLNSLIGGPIWVGGSFWCRNNRLTNLEGGPSSVGRDFVCHHNQLTSLEGGPDEVGRDFYCYNNQLTSLDGGPDNVGGEFRCDEPFKTLIGSFNSYNDFKDSIKEYGWLEGNQIIQVKFQDAVEDENYSKPGMIIPDKIEGFEYI
jgi:hypothetical protein